MLRVKRDTIIRRNGYELLVPEGTPVYKVRAGGGNHVYSASGYAAFIPRGTVQFHDAKYLGVYVDEADVTGPQRERER